MEGKNYWINPTEGRTTSNLGALEKGEAASFHLPVLCSSLLFPFPGYYSSGSFFSLILSTEKLPSLLPSLLTLLPPSPFALVPPQLGRTQAPNLLTVTDGCHRGTQWQTPACHQPVQLALERKNQSQRLTWGRLI